MWKGGEDNTIKHEQNSSWVKLGNSKGSHMKQKSKNISGMTSGQQSPDCSSTRHVMLLSLGGYHDWSIWQWVKIWIKAFYLKIQRVLLWVHKQSENEEIIRVPRWCFFFYSSLRLQPIVWCVPALFSAEHWRFWKTQTKFRQVCIWHSHAPRTCAQSLGVQQTSSGRNDESLVRRICFFHITGESRVGVEQYRGRQVAAEGEQLLICSMQRRHLTNFLQPFKWLPPLAHLCFLPVPHWECSQRNRSMQMRYRPLKGTFGSKLSPFTSQDCSIMAMLQWRETRSPPPASFLVEFF